MNDLLVKQSNLWVRYTNQAKLKVNEKKILMYCLALTNSYARQHKNNIDIDKLQHLEFELKDYCKMVYNNTDKSTWSYTRIKNDIKHLADKIIEIDYTKDNKDFIFIASIFNDITINKTDGTIKIEYNKKILNNYIDILAKNDFTMLKFETFIKINNKYGQRIYELAKSLESLGETRQGDILTWEYDTDYLFNHLLEKNDKGEIKNKSYTNNLHIFEIKVLDTAKESINNSGLDIHFDYKKLSSKKYKFIFDYRKSDKKDIKYKQDLIENKKENYEKFKYDKQGELNKKKAQKRKKRELERDIEIPEHWGNWDMFI